MPVPGQPSPLDLYNAKKIYAHIWKYTDTEGTESLFIAAVCAMGGCAEAACRCTFSFWEKQNKTFLSACASVTNLDLAGAGKTASTAAGSEATAARAVLPGPTSLSSGFTPETPRPARIRLLFGTLAYILQTWEERRPFMCYNITPVSRLLDQKERALASTWVLTLTGCL